MKHNRSYTGEKPFACTHCESSFSDACELRRHIKVHTGEMTITGDTVGYHMPVLAPTGRVEFEPVLDRSYHGESGKNIVLPFSFV